MKVFISWSGATSRQVAELLYDWIGDVVQGVTTWYSPDDIDKGSMWFSEIHQTLSEYNVGIICVTPENKNAPWIMFEAGALSKGLAKARVCPLLIGNLSPADITPPLSHFNLTLPEELDMLRLLRTINSASEHPLDDERLEKAFIRWWPDFKGKYEEIISKKPVSDTPKRSTPDLLSEVLEGLRHIQRSLPPTRAIDEITMYSSRVPHILPSPSSESTRRLAATNWVYKITDQDAEAMDNTALLTYLAALEERWARTQIPGEEQALEQKMVRAKQLLSRTGHTENDRA